MSSNQGLDSRKLPLRFLLVVPFALQISAVVGVTGWISLQNGQRAVNDLAAQLRHEVTARIEQKLRDHLKTAPLVNQINVDAIQMGSLSLADQTQFKQHLLQQLQQFTNLSGITLATEAPNYVGIAYSDQGARILSLWNLGGHGITDSTLDPNGQIASSEVDPDYDHRRRPWYQAAVQAGQPIWQAPYVTINPQRLVISADQPFYDAQGQLLGVADAELSLSSISDFLSSIRVGRSGQTFIVERNGSLVAASTTQPPFRLNPATQQPERLLASESSNPLVRETARYLVKQSSSLSQIDSPQQFDFVASGQRLYVQVMPFHDPQGLDWLVVVAVPEADFMEAIHANTRTTILLCLAALGLAIGVGLITAQLLIRPILGLATAADALAQGDWQKGNWQKGNWQQQLPRSQFGELTRLATAFSHMAEQLQVSFSALQYNAYHDPLTGLFNQTAFRRRLRDSIARRDHLMHQRSQNWRDPAPEPHPAAGFAVLFLDLDYFKLVNDSLGHLIGDQLLVAVTERLSRCLAEHRYRAASDIMHDSAHDSDYEASDDRSVSNDDSITDMLARFGGDEFVILIDPAQTITDATRLAERISAALQRPFNIEGNQVFISTSVGIVMSTSGGADPESFLQNADIALYRAKANGKANYEVFDAAMHTQAVERLQLETDLRQAIDQQELQVYYQPIVEIHTGQITGFEALLRWQHPVQGWVSPAEFIPIAEETGLIMRLGDWTLEQACRQMQLWQQQFSACQTMTISINLSSRQFFQADFLQKVEQVRRQTGLAAQSLKLEITESIFMNPGKITKTRLARLKQTGVQLSIDDFGTGYSSLSYLHRFPIDTLKIDRSFIGRLEANSSNLDIVEAIVVLAHKLGMTVVAEGVETPEQLRWLQQMGCEQVQGFLFSCPVDAAQITAQLATSSTLKLQI